MFHKERIKQCYLFVRAQVLNRISRVFTDADKLSPRLESIDEIQRILFIRNDRVGDLVLSLPAIAALRDRFPGARITVLASWSNHPLLNGKTPADEYVILDRRMKPSRQKAVICSLRSKRFDLAVDPFTGPDLRPALTAFLSRSKIRLGYSGFGREVFFNLRVSAAPGERHFVDASLDVLKPIGVVAAPREPRMFLSPAESAWGRRRLEKAGWKGQPVVGIHPGAHYWTQRWPEEYYSALIKRLQDIGTPWIVLFGGRGDRTVIEKILRGVRKTPMVYMADDLRRFAAIASVCKVFVCNNSGPLHLAAALGVPTVSFMGPTVKSRWYPVGAHHTVFRRDDLSCIGCNRGYCMLGTHECLRSITPERPWRTCRLLIER
ncbi:MAG: glycosyltransferase family 9 protein [Desulfobacterales bacterium]|nr:glycosyltransferase family 9 protein [Desulfobacterales bacterium]